MIKSISLVLPAKNEEKNIKKTIITCRGLLKKKKIPFEIIVVVNNSTDSTAEIVKKMAKKMPELLLIEEKKAVLKGGAVELGFNRAKYDCVGFIDSDNTFTTPSILKVLNAFDKEDVSAVLAKKTYRSIKRKILSNGLGLLTQMLFGLKNTQTGLKLFKRKDVLAAFPLKEKGWIFDLEILWKMKKKGKKIIYVPIVLRKSSEGGFSNGDVAKMLAGLIRIRFRKFN